MVRLSPILDFGREFCFNSSNPQNVLVGGRKLNLDLVTGIYARLPAESLEFTFSPRNDVERYAIHEEATAWFSVLLMIDAEKWINHPRSEIAANAKPFSLLQAARCGISVPNFIIGNYAQHLLDFANQKRTIIKPISDAPIALQNGEYISTPDFGAFSAPFTADFDREKVDLERWDSTPTLLQEKVERNFELRVTVIDKQFFSARDRKSVV